MMWRMSGIKIASDLPLPISRSLSKYDKSGTPPGDGCIKA